MCLIHSCFFPIRWWWWWWCLFGFTRIQLDSGYFFLARHLLFLIKACILYSVCVCLYVLHTVTLYVDLWDDNYLWWIDVFFMNKRQVKKKLTRQEYCCCCCWCFIIIIILLLMTNRNRNNKSENFAFGNLSGIMMMMMMMTDRSILF